MRLSPSRTVVSLVAVLSATLTAAFAGVPANAQTVPVRFLGESIVPHRLSFEGTTVGGLSGIDLDPCTGEYALISDDRSYQQPARFYTARIDVDGDGVHGVRFTGTHALRQPDGTTYPPPTLNDGKAIDPEDIRVDPATCRYWWSQEGNRPKTKDAPDPVIQPSIQVAGRQGEYMGTLPLPEDYRITTGDRGPRRNLALEAITFSPDGSRLTSAVEGPLLQDGPESTTEHGSLARVTQQSRTGAVLGQFAYPLEPLFAEPDPDSPWSPDTGIPSILAYPGDANRYLVMERTYVPGSGFRIRIFDATTRGATRIQNRDSLASAAALRPMGKQLLVDLDDLPLSTVDNVEGMTWGPRLATGERTLVLVSDDNFSSDEVTQVIALALP
ncbi:esterase-like activity of phytase family protein [Streptomyces sp. TS71-3]|uniref:esterase-like activity of phytase family protein n=1 Tax=Streptomyces sp. TS71-3 TaxID=2733862 RepID=UPI001B0E18E6|nr:esterase-like activity of phytase family protein [Streptomyces sp. TS71-3]GHJ37013.1 3-phytase [Streptomyces sp. TS71-3]